MLLDWNKVVQIADKHHLAITIKPDGAIHSDKRELARLYRLYMLEEEFEQYKGGRRSLQGGTKWHK